MNLRASYRYQLADHKKSILAFYIVIICLYLLIGISFAVFSAVEGVEMNGSISGLEMTTAIFLFVSGLNSFKENFGMLTQNGVSRRSLLVGRIFVIATVSIFMALIDRAWHFISAWMSQFLGNTVDSTLFMDMIYNRSIAVGPFALHMEALAFNIAMYFAALSVGYLITVIFYRVNKLGKIIIGAGVPVFFLIILPIIDVQFFNGLLSYHSWNFVVSVLGIISGNPMYAVGTFFAVSVIMLAASWLVMRRVALHE